MDVMMPLMTGEEAAKKIRAIENQRGYSDQLPIIAMYSNTDLEYKDGAHPGCFSASLSKPVTMSGLIEKLSSFK